MMITVSGTALSVTRHGDGDRPVLLLHPLALSGHFWDPLVPELSHGVTLLALDARGHGASSWDGRPFSVEDMADDAAGVLRAVVPGERAAVVGMSMGGCTALSLVQRHPDLVDVLVLADTTACYGPDRIATWEERARAAETKSREELLPFQLTRWFTEGFRERCPDEVDRVVGIFTRTPGAVHAAASRAMGAFDGTEGLAGVSADTLVIVGEEDYATPPDMAGVLADWIPNSTLQVLEHARHLSLLERQDYWPRLAEHLQRKERA